jgi:hypothetical protein
VAVAGRARPATSQPRELSPLAESTAPRPGLHAHPSRASKAGGSNEGRRLQGSLRGLRSRRSRNPRIEHPNDAIVRITSTAICGSALHMCEGRTAARPGIVFGHEETGDRAGWSARRSHRSRRAITWWCRSTSLVASAQLHRRLHRVLPDCQLRVRRRCQRIRRHGPYPARLGRVPPCALRQLRRHEAAARHRARDGLRPARRHLPDEAQSIQKPPSKSISQAVYPRSTSSHPLRFRMPSVAHERRRGGGTTRAAT